MRTGDEAGRGKMAPGRNRCRRRVRELLRLSREPTGASAGSVTYDAGRNH